MFPAKLCCLFQDGSIRIPEVLQEHMDGETVIKSSDKIPRLSWIKFNKLNK